MARPVYELTGPGGETFELEGPEGFTGEGIPDEVMQAAQGFLQARPSDLPARPSPLQPEGPAFSTAVPGLVQGEDPSPAAPLPQRHGLIAAGVQKLGFPGAAGAIERADQALPAAAKAAVAPLGEAFESAGLPGVGAMAALNPVSLPAMGLAAALNPQEPVAAAAGMMRGQLEEALPPFLSGENLLLMAVSRGTGMAAKYAQQAKLIVPEFQTAMAAAARLGEVGETTKYAKQIEQAVRRFGQAQVVAHIGKTVESAFAVGLGGKGATEGWEAAKRGDWQGVAQAFINLAVAGGIGASARATRIPKAGARVDTAPFLKEAQHESIARPQRAEASLEAFTEKRLQDAWALRGGLNELGPGEPVPGLSPEARGEIAQQARADTLSKGRQAVPGEPVPTEGPPAPGVEETLQIAQEAEQARRILGLVERGQLVLPPEAVAALQADAARGIQPLAEAPVPAAPPAPPPAPRILRPGEPVPSGLPVVEGPVVPTGEPVPTRVSLSTTPEVLGKVPRARVQAEADALRAEIDTLRGQERLGQTSPVTTETLQGSLVPGAARPQPAVVDSVRLRTLEAELSRLEAFLRGEALPPLEEPSPVGPRGLQAPRQGPPEPPVALGAPLPTSEAAPVPQRAVAGPGKRGMGLGEAPPGLSPEAPPAPGLGEPPPTPLDVAATEAAARLKASAGLTGKGPTEAHAGLSVQNLKDMATVAAAKLARAGRPPTKAEWQAGMKKQFGDLPQAAWDRMWEVSEGAATLGKVAGPRVAKQFVEEMAGPPKTERVKQVFGLGDTETQTARRINNTLGEVVRRTERFTQDFNLTRSQVDTMLANTAKLAEEGHMGRETQAAFAKQGTAKRSDTAAMPISEDSIGTTIVGLERQKAHIDAVLADLQASGIPLEAGGRRTSSAFRGDPDLKQAIDSTLDNLFGAQGEFVRVAKALAAQKSTWARIGHRQQEAARLGRTLQATVERIPGAMERLRTAGVQLQAIRATALRKPYLTELEATVKEVGTAQRGPNKDDFLAALRMWRLQFSNFSFLKDISSDAASLSRTLADATFQDAYWSLRAGKLEAPGLRSLVEAAHYRATKGAFQPVEGGIEEGLGRTAFGVSLRPGKALPAGASWQQRAIHALNREGGAGEATMRGGESKFDKALSIAMDEGSARGLYLKSAADTATGRLVATAHVFKHARMEATAKGLKGADLEAFIDNYRQHPPRTVRDEAIRLGNEAKFNQDLSSFERTWFRDNPVVQALWDPFGGWMLQHSRWLRDTAGWNVVKAIKNPATSGALKGAEIAGAVGQALAGWGALWYINDIFLPHVDPETGVYRDPLTHRELPLQGIEPLASGVALSYLGRGDIQSFGKMWRYSSLPLGSALSGGGVVGRPVDMLGSFVRDPSSLPYQFQESFMNTVNRLFPERPALEVLKAFTDPISRRGFGSFIPGYSRTLPPIIDPATGEPKVAEWDVMGVSDVLERLGFKREIPLSFGGQIPLARRVVNPVERLLERFDVPSSSAKRVPGIYRNMPDLPGNLSARDLSRAQRDAWWGFYGKERQRILGPLAKDYDKLDERARQDPQFHRGFRMELEALDAAAARSAVDLLMRSDPTLRPTAEKREAPYTGPYADRPGGLGSPVP